MKGYFEKHAIFFHLKVAFNRLERVLQDVREW